jgi:hypothetical protein
MGDYAWVALKIGHFDPAISTKRGRSRPAPPILFHYHLISYKPNRASAADFAQRLVQDSSSPNVSPVVQPPTFFPNGENITPMFPSR